MNTERAWGLIELKGVDEEAREITGIASSVSTDRMGDIVRPKGAKFSLPLPLLHQHDHRRPVGHVVFAEAGEKDIRFRARFAKVDEPGDLKTRIDTAWQEVKHGLVRGVSIGFRPLEHEFLEDNSGIDFKSWEWIELSTVTIPANQDATIQTIRSLDAAALATPRNEPTASSKPAVVGKQAKPVKGKPMTIAEQIAAFEAKRAASTAQMEKLMTVVSEKGETLPEDQAEEYDTLKGEVEQIDRHLSRFRDLEKINLAKAIPVKDVKTTDEGSAARSSFAPIRVTSPVPKGIAFARYVRALALGGGNPFYAAQLAEGVKSWQDSTPEVLLALKTAVNPATVTSSTWAGPLAYAQNLASEFIEYLRPATILGRIPGLRRVPFNVRIPTQTSGSTVNWVGENKPKPVGELAFDALTLTYAKVAGIVTYSDEIGRLSDPSIDVLVRDDLTANIAQFTDQQFLDPDKQAVTNVSPASVTSGVTPRQASGTAIADLLNDVAHLYALFSAANLGLANTVWVMSGTLAGYLGLMQTTLGQVQFPGLNADGGVLLGRPVITSENISTGMMVLLKADDILLADDGGVSIDVSREASLQLNNAPDSPATASTVMTSLWQNNLIGIRAERYITWAKRRTQAVQYIANAGYGGAPGGSGT